MKILYVEDEIAHVELTQRTLEDNLQDSFVLYHAESLQDALKILETESDIDLVLTDLRLPDGSGLDLLKRVKELPSPPAVVLVTGQGDQEVAVAALKAGAADYLVKQSDYLHRLPVVISNAVAQNRLARQQAALREAEVKYQALVEQTPAVVFLDAVDEAQTTIYISPRIEELTGYTSDEWRADLNIWDNHLHPDDRERVLESGKEFHNQSERFQAEYRLIRKDGKVVWIKEDTSEIRDKNGNLIFRQGIMLDVTKDKENEAALQRQLRELTTLHAVATAEAESISEDEIIKKVTTAISQIYSEVCGILLLDVSGNILIPHPSYFGADVSNWQNGYPITTGITGKAVSTGKILRIGDISKESDYIEIATQIQSELCVPIRVNERVIGVLNVESQKPFAFDEEDERLLGTIAGGLGTALERLRLFNEERRRANEFTALYATTSKLTAKWDLPGLLGTVLIQAIELLKATSGGIYLYNAARGDLEVAVTRGDIMRPGTRLQPGEGMAGQVAITHQPIFVDDYATWEHRSAQYANLPIRAVVEVPMLYSGELIGVLAVIESDNSTRKFTKADADLLSLFAAQAASAIENVRLFEAEKQRRQEAAAIAEVGRDISSTLQLDAVLERIAEYARDLLYADASAVFLADTTEPILRAIAAVGEDAKEIKNDPLELGKGILGNIALHKMGEVVNYTINDPRTILIKNTESDPDEHIMGVPILSKDQHTGLIAVWRSGSDNEFLQSDLEFLNSLAQQAATAIENARLYNEAQLRLNDLEVINRISTALRSTKSLDEILPIFLDETLKLLQSEHGSLWLYDAVQNELVQRTARGLPIEFKTRRIGPTEGIVGHVFSSGELHVSEEFLSDPLLFKGNLEQTPPGLGGMCVPIQSTAGPVGAILIEMDKSKHTPNQIGLLTTLTEIAGNAIHRAELYEQGQEQIRRLTTLRDIDSAIASSTDLRVTLNILMDHTLKHLKTDAMDIMLYHPELQSLTYLCSAGFNSLSPSRPLMRLGEGLAGQVVMKGGSEYVADLRVSNEVKRDPMLIREGFITYFGIPLIVKGQIKGVFEIFHRAPFIPPSEWMQFLQTLAGQAAIAIDNSQLFEHLQRSNQEVTQAYDTTLEGWARALELRDRETEGHTRRVTELTMQLARFMNIPDDDLVNIYRGVLLHDIGKMGVPDQILRKTGPLIDSEWVEMRKHPEYAFNLLVPIPYLRPALDIPYCHHEHWDGSGYPRGLKGEQIPLAARIFSIVDIWDALLSDRVYRKAWPKPKVIEYLKETSGEILDPKVVVEFLKMMIEEDNETG